MSQITVGTYARLVTYNYNKILYVCVAGEMLRKSMCQLYRKADYDFSNFIVFQCLANVRDCKDEEKYLCLSCHKRLQETNNNNIVLPYYGKYPDVKAGANFLKSLQEMPQCVCTYSHHLVSQKQLNLPRLKNTIWIMT